MREVKRMALNRIKRLFELAEKRPEMQQRYIELAVKISKRTNTRIPKELKRKICKKCYRLLLPGAKVRLSPTRKTIEYRCVCGAVRRFRYKK